MAKNAVKESGIARAIDIRYDASGIDVQRT